MQYKKCILRKNIQLGLGCRRDVSGWIVVEKVTCQGGEWKTSPL